MEELKRGSWAVLMTTMTLTFLVVRYISKPWPYLVAPGIVFVKFLTDTYYHLINDFGKRVKNKFQDLWHKLTRKKCYA